MGEIVSFAKRRGFIYPGSEIYSGLAGTWDYGPLGALFKKSIKDAWWTDVVERREDMVGIDAAIMMNPRAWEASGHVEAFTDPLIECKICHQRFRADHEGEIKAHATTHPNKKASWTEPKKFNLLVPAFLGVIEGEKQQIYLRGEITNGAQVNFKNILDTTRVKIPFGIAQIGKAFRNEITPGNFTFRSREFEQMETQFYIRPDNKEADKWFSYWKQDRWDWYVRYGLNPRHLRWHEHRPQERAHYAQQAFDIEYHSPFGWAEFIGIHDRGDWDLKRHQEFSGQDVRYRDPESGDVFLPWDIETSAGVDRSLLFFLIEAYHQEDDRLVLKLHPRLAPYKVAVFPLLANKPPLVKQARDIFHQLQSHFMVAWDDRGNIGKRYYSQDEIGTPFCVTIDFDTLEGGKRPKGTVTVRERDSMKQTDVAIGELVDYLRERLA
ncbi:MAG: glycine--tRNA ligase [Candidatus Kerfeldbacteria bacterium]|nr:glycine--tRNA ligase [Candidatus Kerfeldbacteria bacterium]